MNFNFQLVFVVALCLLCALDNSEGRKNKKSRKAALTKGKSGRPRVRKFGRGSVQAQIDDPQKVLMRCQFLEKNFGQDAYGIEIRKCKVKRPYKKKVDLTCQFGDLLCAKCDMAKCESYKKDKRKFLFQLAKRFLEAVKRDPVTKELYCSEKPVKYEEDSCRLEIPRAIDDMDRQPRSKTSAAFTPKATSTTVTPTTTTTTTTAHASCEDDPSQLFCNTFMSWGNFIFNQPFENR